MANTDVKKLLVRLKVTTDSWKSALVDIRRMIEEERRKETLSNEKIQQNLEKQIGQLRESIDTTRQRTKEIESQIKSESKLRGLADTGLAKLKDELTSLRDKTKEQQAQIRYQEKNLTNATALIERLKEEIQLSRQKTAELKKHSSEQEAQGRWTDEARRKQSEMMKEKRRQAEEDRKAQIEANITGVSGYWTPERRAAQSAKMKEEIFQNQLKLIPRTQVPASGDFTPVGFPTEIRNAYIARQAALAVQLDELKAQEKLKESQRESLRLEQERTHEAKRRAEIAAREAALEKSIIDRIAKGLPAGGAASALAKRDDYGWYHNEKGRMLLKPGWSIGPTGRAVKDPEPVHHEEEAHAPVKTASRSGGHGDGGGEGIANAVSGLLGNNLGASLIGGFTGGAAVVGIQLIENAIEHLSHTIKEFIAEASPIINLVHSFERLSEEAGIGAEKFAGDLRKATDGLVADQKLFQFANLIMRENTGLSADQITELTDVTSRFSRVVGKDPIQSLNLLNRTLQTGRLSMLAYQLGLDPATRDLLELTDGLEKHERVATQVNVIQKEMERQLALTGEPVDGITERFQRLSTWVSNTHEHLVEYVAQSSELNTFLALTDSIVGALRTSFEQAATALKTLTEFQIFELFRGADIEKNAEDIGLLSKGFILAAKGVEFFTSSLEDSIANLKLVQDLLNGEWNIEGFKKAFTTLNESKIEIQKKFNARMLELDAKLHPEHHAEDKKEHEKTEADLKTARDRHRLLLDLERDAANLELTIAKNLAQRKKEISEDVYKHGTQSLQAYVDAQKKAAEIEYQAELTKIRKLASIEARQITIEEFGTEENAALARKHPNLVFQAKNAPTKVTEPTKETLHVKETVKETLKLEPPKYTPTPAGHGVLLDKNVPTQAHEEKLPSVIYRLEDAEKIKTKRDSASIKLQDQELQAAENYRREIKKLDDSIIKDELEAYRQRLQAETDLAQLKLDNRSRDLESQYQLGKISSYELDRAKELIIVEKQKLEQEAAYNKLITVPSGIIRETDKEEYQSSLTKSQATREQQEADIQRNVSSIARGAAQRREETELELREMALQSAAVINKHEFDNRRITVDDLIRLERDRILAQEDIELDRAEIIRKYAVKNEQTEVDYLSAVVKINQSTNDKIDQLKRDTPRMQLDAEIDMYETRMRRLTAEQSSGKAASAVIKEKIQLTSDFIATIDEERAALGKDSEEANQRLEILNKTRAALLELEQAQRQMNEALADSADIFGSFFASLGTDSDKGFSGVVKGISQGLNIGSNFQRSLNDYRTNPLLQKDFSSGDLSMNPFQGFTQTLDQLINPKKNDQGNKALETSEERLKKFNVALASVTQALSGIYQVFQARGAVAGGIGGAMSGSGLGGMVGSLFSKAGGPIGAAIGAAVGTLVGVLSGNARKKTEEAATKMVEAFNKITTAFELGNINLREAIGKMVTQRAATIENLSGRKGGREQLDKMLPQIEQQITQLRKQQKQLLDALKLELTILHSPEGLQGYVQDLNSIIEKYKEFDGALGDVGAAQAELSEAQKALKEVEKENASNPWARFSTETTEEYKAAIDRVTLAQEQLKMSTESTGKAQEYLNLTLKQYIETQKDSLNDAEMDAVQNALQLNQLLEDRTKLLKDAKEQEYDIRTTGILIRQRTTAQVKMSEIDKLKESLNKQLEQIDKQIELTRFRVDQEKIIFNIATERISLEHQLMTMQKDVISKDIQRIQSLERMIVALQNSGGSLTGLNQLIGSISSLNSFDKMVESSFSQFGKMGYAGFNT